MCHLPPVPLDDDPDAVVQMPGIEVQSVRRIGRALLPDS
jgi:hypothetical protein